MGMLRRALAPPQTRSVSRRMPFLGGSSTHSGVSVDPERSLQIGAVYSCVRLLSEAISGLTISQLEKGNDGRQSVIDDDLLYLVAEEPNETIDAGELWRNVMGWKLLRGNGVVYIERANSGRVKALWPIGPQSVDVKRQSNGRLAYKFDLRDDEYAPIDRERSYDQQHVLHYRAFGLGMLGLSPIGLARQNVGMAFAAQAYMGGFYARDATPGGVIEVEGELSDTAYERMERQWKELHEGWSNSYGLALMEGGAKWKETTLSPADAQFIETQKFTRSEIASIYGVPPHMIGDTEKSTSWGTGLAEQGIGFVNYSLRPWVNRLERVTRRGLLIGQPRRRFVWSVADLQKGDAKDRAEAYATGKQWGWLSTNDIRREEGQEPVEGGDVYLQPLNMVPAGPGAPAPVSERARQERSLETRASSETAWEERVRVLLRDAFQRQREDVLGRLGQGMPLLDRDRWDDELAQVLRAPAREVTFEAARAIVADFGGEFDESVVEAFIAELARQKARNLNITTETALADGEGDEADVTSVFDHAEDTRSGAAAATLVVASTMFGRVEGAIQSGARTKTWRVRSGNPRTSHARLNGQTVPVSEPFSNGAMWPGDPRAGVDEVAGCTCEVVFTDA